MRQRLLTLGLLALALPAWACGSERWLVKTLQDETFSASLMASDPALATVGALRNLERPKKLDGKARAPAERRYVYAPVVIRGFKLETDGDFHLVVAAENQPSVTMIAEVPDPRCANPRYAPQFGAARTALAKLATPRAVGKMIWFQNPPRAIVEGMVFFDKLHGQTGLAPNGVEIHPVLALELH